MRFTPQFLDELRARLPVSEVVGRRVKLRKQGREFIGLSPFNKEKSPSFTVNDQKGFFHDFSSGKHGDIFGFVMETEGVGFPEAVERLAQLAGVPLPKVSHEDEARDARRKTLHDVMELAAKFFEATLAARAGAKARGYLADRGLDSATQLKFRLGYAPGERFALKEHLGSHGIPVEDMVEAGLLVAGDDIPLPFDRFRDRVMFPITDLRGRVIAFGGRALEKDAQAKYLNSPETPLFHKGATLYNIASARQAAHDGAARDRGRRLCRRDRHGDGGLCRHRRAARHRADRRPARAAVEDGGRAGALLRRRQCRPARGLSRGRTGDAAAQARQEPEIRAAAARPGPGRSGALGRPRGGGRGDRRRAAARRQMLWARETEGHSFDTPERRAALEARINEVTSGIGDEAVRRYYRQDFNARLAQFFAPAQSPRGNFQRGQGQAGGQDWRERGNSNWQPRNGAPPRPATGGKNTPYVVVSQQLASSPLHRGHRIAVPTREALILQAALNYPWLLHDHLEEFASLEFRHADAERLKSALVDIAAHAAAADAEAVRAELAGRGLTEVMDRIAAAITTQSVWGARPDAAPEDVLVTWQQLVALHRQWHSLTKELKDAEQALGQDNSEANYLRLRDVKARLSRMDGTEALIEGFGASSGRGARSL